MRIRVIAKSSYGRQAHEGKRATTGSLLESIGELGERYPVRSFYETPAQWLAAHAGRDLFPVFHLVPNRTRLESEFAVRRGELQIPIPVGFCWAPSGKLEKDPDQRVQQAIELVFRKMIELGSVRQVLRCFREENLLLPAFPHGLGDRKMIWQLP